MFSICFTFKKDISAGYVTFNNYIYLCIPGIRRFVIPLNHRFILESEEQYASLRQYGWSA